MAIRVVQWASGNVGRSVIRAVAERADLELVGLHVTNPAKAGVDAGELAGIGPLGVVATVDADDVLELAPDVVVHTPLPSLVYGDEPDRDVDDICRLLASGTDVITTVGYMYPVVHGEAIVERFARACDDGRSSLHGTGANPGWFGDLLPLLMSGLSLRIDRVLVREISNFQHYPSPEIMFGVMGFGLPPDEFAARSGRHRRWLDGLFTEAVRLVADGLDARVDEVRSEMSTFVAEQDHATAAGLVPTGTVAGQRWRWSALQDGRPIVEQETVWRMHADAAPEWPTGDWSVSIEGEPRMHVELGHGWNRDVLASTAAHAVNAIPYVVAARPGIVTFLDLPIVAGRGAVRPPR